MMCQELARSEFHCICKTDHHVDIQGIDNHQITGVNIVTAGGVVTTQHGHIIVISNQYACMSQSMIHLIIAFGLINK